MNNDRTLNGSWCAKHRLPLPCRNCVTEHDVAKAASLSILQLMNRGFIDPQNVRKLRMGRTK